MAAYGNRTMLVNAGTSLAVGNSETDLVVSKVDQISCGDSRDMFVVAEVSSVSGGAGTLTLQHCHRKDGTFTDVSGATVTISGNGTFQIAFDEVDGANNALLPFIRILADTGGSDAFTIDRLYRTVRVS